MNNFQNDVVLVYLGESIPPKACDSTGADTDNNTCFVQFFSAVAAGVACGSLQLDAPRRFRVHRHLFYPLGVVHLSLHRHCNARASKQGVQSQRHRR